MEILYRKSILSIILISTVTCILFGLLFNITEKLLFEFVLNETNFVYRVLLAIALSILILLPSSSYANFIVKKYYESWKFVEKIKLTAWNIAGAMMLIILANFFISWIFVELFSRVLSNSYLQKTDVIIVFFCCYVISATVLGRVADGIRTQTGSEMGSGLKK